MKSMETHQLHDSDPRKMAKKIRQDIPGLEHNDVLRRLRVVQSIGDEEIRSEVANLVFGQKLAGDLGARSTLGHPRTNYGNPSFTGSYDVADK